MLLLIKSQGGLCYEKKYHPIRFYVMNTDVTRILISHATSYWLGLVRVLCDNKAPRIKRQVASIDKKSNFRVKSSHVRTSTPEETDDTEDGHFRKGSHSKSKNAQFRGRQNTRKKDSHRSETWQRCGCHLRGAAQPRRAICDNWKGAKDIKIR